LLRHPAYRRRELNTGVYREQEKLSPEWQEKISSCKDSEIESIDDWHRGRSLRSSDKDPVMEAERKEAVIKFLFIDEN
jgi:hypothetical protein